MALDTRQDLVHRLNRIIGQVEAIRRTVESEECSDCTKTLQQIKAAGNALKKFGEAYVNRYLENCMSSHTTKKELEKDLKEVVSSAFFL